eukprot:TRINITY_DN689_c0_g1_i1.p1 TRINITY_DN689_c0_g1~~TRINITY_DN689_c0_g1_i1.p1  ORF type:complete len:788 (-),score=277.19 TRINITY_DN689_c0_g1_i1:72-2333(-)
MSKYFSSSKRGELTEIKDDLNSSDESRKKEALKKLIADMTVGKDVSMLFSDVVKCMTTSNLELKKLVYLYLLNYAKSQPEIAILAVNTFVIDSQNFNPLIRALAIRTMGCIRVDSISEYLCEPLRKALKDADPYVKKTAAICVAKLHDINPDLVVEQGFLDALRDLLSDSNPMVVSNTIAAITEINETIKVEPFKVHSGYASKLLTAINECSEWGQVFILQALANYLPKDAREAENIAERVTPRLQHSNAAVVLAAVRVILNLFNYMEDEAVKLLCKKMGPPLVTLLSKEAEVQYVALRNINLIIQKRPSILAYEMRVFFCKYNDPLYVKLEKLEIMIMLCSDRNVEQVLMELKEYATEADVEFVRKSVRVIGRCAIKLEKAADRCISVLMDLIQTKVNYIVQEAIIVIKDIFRKYPNRYERIISALCENLETLDEPEAKASMIWILGEYAERIENTGEILESFLENFGEENSQVQLQLLTASVKLFLKRPKESQQLVQNVLELTTSNHRNPDIRDRGFLYWRLLSFDPEAAKKVVLSERPLISEQSTMLDGSLLDKLLANISTLSSVYHKTPETFVSKLKDVTKQKTQVEEDNEEEAFIVDLGGPPQTQSSAPGGSSSTSDILDLSGIDKDLPSVDDPLSFLSGISTASTKPVVPAKAIWLTSEQSLGLQISGAFSRRDQRVIMDLTLHNLSSLPMSDFAVQFNKNTFGLSPSSPNIPLARLMPGESANHSQEVFVGQPNHINPSITSRTLR